MHCFRPSIQRNAVLVMFLMLAASPCTTARADLIVDITASSAAAGGSGAFDVRATNNGSDQHVAAFSFVLNAPAGSGITFTSASYPPASGENGLFYIFQGSSFNAGNRLSLDTFPNSSFAASDFTTLSFVTVPGGEAVLLGSVGYRVTEGTTPGPVALSFDTNGTSLTDESVNTLTTIFKPNTTIINVTASAVPEPSSLALMSVAAALLGYRLRRRSMGPKNASAEASLTRSP